MPVSAPVPVLVPGLTSGWESDFTDDDDDDDEDEDDDSELTAPDSEEEDDDDDDDEAAACDANARAAAGRAASHRWRSAASMPLTTTSETRALPVETRRKATHAWSFRDGGGWG